MFPKSWRNLWRLDDPFMLAGVRQVLTTIMFLMTDLSYVWRGAAAQLEIFLLSRSREGRVTTFLVFLIF